MRRPAGPEARADQPGRQRAEIWRRRARRAAPAAAKTLVQIDIEDNGPGIAAELMETVFEPFRRLETSRNRETGGSGLGLAIARNILRAHGGDILLHNLPQGGLKASVTLPV